MDYLPGPQDDWAMMAGPTQPLPPRRAASGPASPARPARPPTGSPPRGAPANGRYGPADGRYAAANGRYPAQAPAHAGPRPGPGYSGPVRSGPVYSGPPGRQPGMGGTRSQPQPAAMLPPLPRSAYTGQPISPGSPRARPVYTDEYVPPPPYLGVKPGKKRWRERPGARRALFVLALVAILATVLAAVGIHRLSEIGSTISTQGAFTTQTGYMTGTDRVNVLVMGYGGAGHDGAYLTDSMMVISVVPDTGATAMISVPRDLWVQIPPGSGGYGKLNTAFNDGMQHGFGGYGPGKVAGGAEAANKVSEILGIAVPYWLTIDFSGFRDLVNALGGVDITVPVAFTANYPANDDPAVNASWKTIHFTTGPQHMDGERAIEYARARYVTSPLSEASDFARSARQQLLIRAILGKARQVSAWPGLNKAADAMSETIYSNLSLLDLGLFAQRMDTTHAAHIGLSDQNVLVDAQSSDGQDILQPANGDWGAIQQYVQQHLNS